MNHDGGLHEIPLPGVPGRLWLCGKHLIGPDPQAVIERTGAHTVVCLTERHELVDRYPRYVAWLDEHHRQRQVAVWFPVHDLNPPPDDAGRAMIDDLVERLRRGDGLVVHCAAGIGRAGTTAVAVLVALGMPLDAAVTHVRRHRPMAGPEVGGQLRFVERLRDAYASAQHVADDVEPQAGGQSQRLDIDAFVVAVEPATEV